tara:strand:+ start:683 stop:1507 length:825 start_codon:yes stop_codon:yes gene_type:complete
MRLNRAHNQKKINNFRQGRINSRLEVRRQLVLRNNLEKRFFRKLNTLFRKFINVHMHLYKQYGIYEQGVAAESLNEDLFPLMLSHYRRTFQAMYKFNEDKYERMRKAEEAFVFGRSTDFEAVVNEYFNSRQLILSGISARLASRISRTIEIARAENLTLPQIAKLVSDKFLPIGRSRAALIARTETHNAASFANHSYHLSVERDLGVKMQKQWVATNDARTRQTHAAASGQTVDMSEDFIVGGVPMSFAGDSRGGAANVINCRCVIVYADERDM